jgi:hypothetical protein
VSRKIATVVMLAAGMMMLLGVACGVAAADEPLTGGLTIHSFATGGAFSEGESPDCAGTEGAGAEACYGYQVTVLNSGGGTAEGPIVVKEHLPSGFTVRQAVLFLDPAVGNGRKGNIFGEEIPGGCSSEGEPVTVTCTFGSALVPDEAIELRLFVSVAAGTPSGQLSTASVTGTGSPEASVTEPLLVSSAPAAFGPSALVSYIASGNGDRDAQAGAHPYELATRIDLRNTVRVQPEGLRGLTSVHDAKDVIVDLPMGLLGDAQATPTCTFGQLESVQHCPADTRVGQIQTEPEDTTTAYIGIYNMVPERGVAAEFGFIDAVDSTHAIYASVAPTPAGYVLRATSREVPQIPLTNVTAIFFGNPAAKDEAGSAPVAMFTNPSDCSATPLIGAVHMDSWQEPGQYNSNASPVGEPDVNGSNWATALSDEWPFGGAVTPATTGTVTGCNQLRFNPSAFTAQPDTSSADSPTGFTIDEQIPQSEQPGTLATPPLRNEIVTLPPGLVPNPASASGLTGCSEAQIGWLGGTLTNFTPSEPACPDASKIGSVEVTTPLIDHTLPGTLYLAKQNENPFGTILAGYIVIDDPVSGIIVKVPGKITLNEATGQVTGNFSEAPQLGVFSDLKLRFFGGERGELATPESCGTYATDGQLTPWSAPESGPPANVESSFAINARCVPEFAPSFAAATSSPQAGGYSPLTLTFARQDNEQEISSLTVTLPPGLTAKLAGVAKCSTAQLQAAQANPSGAAETANPSCPAASEIGTVQASAGAGANPFVLGGKAYLTGPYNNAPLGLAVIVPAVAGPFDLGNVVVRTALHVDPNDAHVTAVSDPLPTIVDAKGLDNITDGFPVRMRSVTVSLNRNTYVLNPTNCNVMAIGAVLTSTGGRTSAGSSRFQAGGCRELAFKPGFAAGTQGHASKLNGTSLKVHVTSSFGQANIAKVKVTLPQQLPSRLTTLQKACLDSVFNINPAACPEGSVVGTALARTPLLEQPFTGPAYLVSHGGAAFPDLEYVLESEGIKLILDGKTDIKKGITTSSFETVPDAPVSSFETNFPAGPHSILGTFLPPKANYNLCGQALTMPTTITGQNGAVVKQTTKITINGCPKAKKKHKAKKHKTKHTTKKH